MEDKDNKFDEMNLIKRKMKATEVASNKSLFDKMMEKNKMNKRYLNNGE